MPKRFRRTVVVDGQTYFWSGGAKRLRIERNGWTTVQMASGRGSLLRVELWGIATPVDIEEGIRFAIANGWRPIQSGKGIELGFYAYGTADRFVLHSPNFWSDCRSRDIERAKLTALQTWRDSRCKDDWDHNYCIKIDTCDDPGWGSPGWWVKIDLRDTPLQSASFATVADNVDVDGFQRGDEFRQFGNWMYCYVEGDFWNGTGDVNGLMRILQTFLEWIAAQRVKKA